MYVLFLFIAFNVIMGIVLLFIYGVYDAVKNLIEINKLSKQMYQKNLNYLNDNFLDSNNKKTVSGIILPKSKDSFHEINLVPQNKIPTKQNEIPTNERIVPKKETIFNKKETSDFAEEDILRITKTHTLVFAEQKVDESDIGSSDIECQALCDCDYNPMNDDSIEEIDVTVTADSSWAETMDKYREEKVETEYEVKKEILL